MRYLEVNNLINANQHGFRSGHNCATQLISQLYFVLSNCVEGHGVDSLYIDYAKAFDKVDHGLLRKKLQFYGIAGEFYNWISNFLEDRCQSVIVNNCLSYPTPVLSGVPQGSVLGPLLFVLYINDMSSSVDSTSQVFTFADDTKLVSTISSSHDKNNLQKNLDSLIKWSRMNNMVLNGDKFELLSYNSNKKTLIS